MGFIEGIKNWIDERKKQKLIVAGVEKTVEAEQDPNKDPLETMIKIAEENPDIVVKFIQKVIENRQISDKNISAFLQNAPDSYKRDAIKGIRTLSDDVNIKGDAAPSIANSLKSNVQNLENPDLEKIREAMLKVGKSNMDKEQEEEFEMQKQNLEEQIEIKTQELLQTEKIKQKEEKENMLRKQQEEKKQANFELRSMLSNKDEEYWKNQGIFSSENNNIIRRFYNNDPSAEEIVEFNKLLAQLIAKRKAYDYANYGTTIIFDSDENMSFENMIKYDVPNLAQEKYENIPDEEKIVNYTNINYSLLELIMRRMARRNALDFVGTDKIEMLQVPNMITNIRKNNPDISEEQIDKLKDAYVYETRVVLNNNDIKQIDYDDICNQLEKEEKVVNEKEEKENVEIIEKNVELMKRVSVKYNKAIYESLSKIIEREENKKQQNQTDDKKLDKNENEEQDTGDLR